MHLVPTDIVTLTQAGNIVATSDTGLHDEPSRRKFDVVTRHPHQDRDGLAVMHQGQRRLYGEFIRTRALLTLV
jgi:hypothetical protein